jgi:hypothetical protein
MGYSKHTLYFEAEANLRAGRGPIVEQIIPATRAERSIA